MQHRLRGLLAVTSMLILASGCDKKTPAPSVDRSQTSLGGKPRALLFVFGDRTDPRVLPIARLADGKITPFVLDGTGWRGFDKLYFPAGGRLSVYEGGKLLGDAVVRRGMWTTDGNPLYKLPGCRATRPLAAVTIAAEAKPAVMMELLAVSDPLPLPPPRADASRSDVDSARALAIRVGQHEGLTSGARSELDEVVSAFPTGATSHPTLVGSYIERGSGLNGKPRHVFVIGDWSDSSHAYVQSLVHVPGDSTREFRRLIDHLDLTGDGVDEIVLEGWRTGDDSYLLVMQYRDGHWREIARGPASWCADKD